LESEGFEVTVVADDVRAYNALDEGSWDALVTETRSARIDGIRLLQVARRTNPDLCAVLIAEQDQIDVATHALFEGAHDHQTRPLNLDKLIAVLRRAEETARLRGRIQELNRRLDRKYGLHNIVGNSAAIAAILAKVPQIGASDATVLILGETGSGKELLATALHQNSKRRNAPLIKLHCGDLSEGLIESELFGHEKGAFTGAVQSRAGRFEMADGGTLFLDELGDLSLSTQAKLLRFIQERELTRLGAERPIRVDVRLIVSTQRDLRAEIEAGRFREDLFYRINVVTLELPPLRQRRQDIPVLVDHFLREAASSAGTPVATATPAVMSRLLRYSWPGNVRELKNTITGMVLSADPDAPLEVGDLPPQLQELPDPSEGIWIPLGTSAEEAERRVIEATFKSVDGDMFRAAQVLGVSLRTLYRRLNIYRGE